MLNVYYRTSNSTFWHAMIAYLHHKSNYDLSNILLENCLEFYHKAKYYNRTTYPLSSCILSDIIVYLHRHGKPNHASKSIAIPYPCIEKGGGFSLYDVIQC